MGRAHEVRAKDMAKTAAFKTKLYSRFGKEIYIAAKSGEPDPEMNLTLKRKIQEAKSNQIPADVINRAIEKAKGGDVENYTEARYEGFGPANSTFIVDCLTDNTMRSMTDVRTAFTKTKGCKMVNSGGVSYNYESVGLFVFDYDNEDKMLEVLLEDGVDVLDVKVDDGVMTVKTTFDDFGAGQDSIEKFIPEVDFAQSETVMIPNEFVTLTNKEDIKTFDKLMSMLNDAEDVNKIYHNVIIEWE